MAPGIGFLGARLHVGIGLSWNGPRVIHSIDDRQLFRMGGSPFPNPPSRRRDRRASATVPAPTAPSAPEGPESTLLRVGNQFNRYQIVSTIGDGGMAVVYDAYEAKH